MPAQKRSAPSPSDDDPLAAGDSPSSPAPAEAEEEEQPFPANSAPDPPEQDDSDGGEGGSPSSPSAAAKDDYILVKLAEIRKEVQCPICLGIIRKTRTVMECLHRFCRECIDKSMRLGNNECPACRTHCASRRSLRDDPNYDALISALYPDIDMYEEEELAFHEEEKTRNRKIQASIAETFRRQSEALGRRRSSAKATAAAFVRKSQGNFRGSYPRGRGRGGGGGRDTVLAGSDDEDEDANGGNHAGKDSSSSSSAEEPSPESRPKRPRRWPGPRASPARTAGSTEVVCEENDDLETSKENFAAVPLQSGTREMLAWGRGGARSQTRHGSASSLSGRFFKGGRVAKLLEHLRNLDENENEFSVHLTLLPLDEKSMPCLDRPYLCCRPTVSIRHLCQLIAIQSRAQVEEVNIFVREAQGGGLPIAPSESEDKALIGLSDELRLLGGEETLGELRASFSSNEGDLVFLYHLENTKQEICD